MLFLLSTKNSYNLYEDFTLIIAFLIGNQKLFFVSIFLLASNSVDIHLLSLIPGTYISLPLFLN